MGWGKIQGASTEPWAKTDIADFIKRLTHSYQVTPALDEVVDRSKGHRCVAVVGDAGMGKSALSAALAWPAKTRDIVPQSFVQGVVLLHAGISSQDLVSILSAQFERSVPGFKQAQDTFTRSTDDEARKKMSTLERELLGPLEKLATSSEIRLVVDGLDRLAIGIKGTVMGALNQLRLCTFIRLVVTARPDTHYLKTRKSLMWEGLQRTRYGPT